MSLSIKTPSSSSLSQIPDQHHTLHKLFLLTNYAILGLSTSCIFLTLSLRLLPSWCGLLLILLHVLTIAAALTGCSSSSLRLYAAHMVSTVVTAIFQGSVSVLVFASTSSFLANIKSYVREEDGAVILKLAGSLCVVIFCLEWVGLGLAFVLRFRDFVENGGGNGNGNGRKVVDHEDSNDWPWPFQV